MRRLIVWTQLAVMVLSPALARAEPVCLPASLFVKDEAGMTAKRLDLGTDAGVPTLCAFKELYNKDLIGCWSVDANTGALSASTATALRGHSQQVIADAKGCIDGYCLGPAQYPDRTSLFASSTDGTRVAIVRYEDDKSLYVFDVATKKLIKQIPLYDSTAPEKTSVGNEPVEVLYVGNTIFVVGSDAGPYIAVWGYKDDGTRTGLITEAGTQSEADNGFSVYNGAFNVIDDTHIALSKAGLYRTLVVTAADGARQELVPPIGTPACTAQEMQSVDVGDYPVKVGDDGYGVSAACHSWVVKNLEPYVDADPIRLPSGDFLAALSGNGMGTLAILDGKTLKEKRRVKLAKCAK